MCGFLEKHNTSLQSNRLWHWKQLLMRTEDSTADKNRSKSLDIVLGLLPLVLGFQLIIWIAYLPTALGGHADFRNCYSAGLILRSGRGHQLYDYSLQREIQNTTISPSPMVLPYVHLPYEALLFAPFTLMSYRDAFIGFLSLNLVLLGASYILLRKQMLRTLRLWRWFPFLFVVGFAPVSATLLQGQDSLLTLLLFLAALVSLDSDREITAGLFSGLALYKFQLVLPIVALLLIWRRWGFALGAAISTLTVLALSAAVSGVSGLTQYFLSLRDISTKFISTNEVLYVMPVMRMPNVRGMILAIPGLPSVFAVATIAAISLILFGIAAWARNERTC